MIWRACERIGIRPPGVPENWDEIPEDNWWLKELILTYSRVRDYEDVQIFAQSKSFGL